jgi:hypothetical protein
MKRPDSQNVPKRPAKRLVLSRETLRRVQGGTPTNPDGEIATELMSCYGTCPTTLNVPPDRS